MTLTVLAAVWSAALAQGEPAAPWGRREAPPPVRDGAGPTPSRAPPPPPEEGPSGTLSTGVVLPAQLPAGRWQLLTPELVVVRELDKVADVERPIGLLPGRYWLRHPEGDSALLAQLTVVDGPPATVDPSQLRRKRTDEDPTQVRPRRALWERHWTVAAGGGWQQVLAPGPERGGSFASQPLVGLEVGFHNAIARGFGLAFDGLYGWSSGSLNTSALSTPYAASQLTFGVSALYELQITERWVPFVGARLALAMLSRSLSQGGLPDQQLITLCPFALGGLTFRFTASLGLSARLRLGVQPSGVSGTPAVGLLEGGLFFGYGFL